VLVFELADEIRGLVRRHGLGDSGQLLRCELLYQLGADGRGGIKENGTGSRVVESAEDALAFGDRKQVEPVGDVLRPDQAQENLQRILFAFTKQGLQLLHKVTLAGRIDHHSASGEAV